MYNELLNLENLGVDGMEKLDKDAEGCIVKRVLHFFEWRSEIGPNVRSINPCKDGLTRFEQRAKNAKAAAKGKRSEPADNLPKSGIHEVCPYDIETQTRQDVDNGTAYTEQRANATTLHWYSILEEKSPK